MRLFDPLIPVSQLEEHLRERETAFSDKIVYADAMSVDDQTGNLIVRNGCSKEHPFQPQALQLLATKLRVPHSYLVRCPPALRATNVNHWLRTRSGQEFFVRFDKDEVRAVLSPRYMPISNVQIVESIRQLAGNVLVRAELDNLRFLMQIITSRGEDVSLGDRIHGGMFAANSEVGHRVVELRAMCYRVLCTNGLILSGGGDVGFRRRHIGDPDSALRVFHKRAELAIEAGATLPSRLGDTRYVKVPDPEPVFGRIASRYDLDEGEQKAIWNAWSMEPGETLFAIINTLTRAGNDRGLGIDSREKLQSLGGRIMTLASEGRRWID